MPFLESEESLLTAVVLFQPEIPPNTGNVIRLCANTGAELHLVEPLGFRWDDRQLKRAGLVDGAELAEYDGSALSGDELPSGISAGNVAYVIYTSGSTGQPKGAGNRHVALTNRLCWMQEAYAVFCGPVWSGSAAVSALAARRRLRTPRQMTNRPRPTITWPPAAV